MGVSGETAGSEFLIFFFCIYQWERNWRSFKVLNQKSTTISVWMSFASASWIWPVTAKTHLVDPSAPEETN